MLIKNGNQLAFVTAICLPAGLGFAGYLAGNLAVVQKYTANSFLFEILKRIPAIDQLHSLEKSRSGELMADRFASIIVCQFVAIIAFVCIGSAVSILKDGWEIIRQKRNVSILHVFSSLIGGVIFAIPFILHLPNEPNAKGQLLEYTDFKFLFFFILAVFCAFPAILLCRYIYQCVGSVWRLVTHQTMKSRIP